MSSERPTSIQEFEQQYAARSGVTVQWLHDHGRWGAPCDCGEDVCEGFQMLHAPEDEFDRKWLEDRGLLAYVGDARA